MPVKISELTAGTALTGAEKLPTVQSGVTVYSLVSQLGTYVRGLFTTTPATIAEGGTNAATAAAARTSLGVGLSAKGSLTVGNGSGNTTELLVGNDLNIPIASSTSTGGIRWGNPYASVTSTVNGYFSHARAGGAETITLLTFNGTTPSATDPVIFSVRGQTLGSSVPGVQQITSALTLTISSGSTLGATNSTAFRLWFVIFDTGSGYQLGVINCLGSGGIYPLAGWGVGSSTAEGGAGTADSAQVIYTTSAVTAKPYAVLGYSTWESGLAAVGTWGTAPTRSQLYGAGVKLPGDTIQLQYAASAAGLASASTSYVDTTNASLAITMTSAANAIRINCTGRQAAPPAGANNVGVYTQLLEAATVIDGNYISAAASGAGGTGWAGPLNLGAFRAPNSASAVTYKIQQKASNGGGAETVTVDTVKMYAEELMT